MDVTVHGKVDACARAAVERLVASQRTMEDVVAWGLAQAPPRLVVAVVVQDEYTHDVVVAYEDDRYLVYDTT